MNLWIFKIKWGLNYNFLTIFSHNNLSNTFVGLVFFKNICFNCYKEVFFVAVSFLKISFFL